jgi:hypothetical membrane protein
VKPVLDRGLCFGAALWIATAQFFVLSSLAAQYTTPEYNWVSQVLSDLGIAGSRTLRMGTAFHSPAHMLFTITLLVQGVCMCGGALLLRETIRSKAAIIACLIAGGTLFGLAAVPEDRLVHVHVAFAAIHCIAANADIFLLVRALKKRVGFCKSCLRCCFGLGVVGACASLCLLFPAVFVSATGLAERIALYPFAITLELIGLRFILAINKVQKTVVN